MHVMKLFCWCCAAALVVAAPHAVSGQSREPSTRTEAIEQEQAERARTLTPQEPQRFEALVGRVDTVLTRGGSHWYPFFQNSYPGGGFPFGAGYAWFVSRYNTLDVRGSITASGYKRVETEFLAPRIFDRRGTLSVMGGWREATRVPFYGLGTDSSPENRASYGFELPFGSALLTMFPTRRFLMLRGGVEYAQWQLQPGEGRFPSVDARFGRDGLAGVDATVNYLHSQVGVGIDTRLSPLYARRGGFYGVTLHQYSDPDDRFGFRQVEYDAVQHIPILREAWVVSLHGRVSTTSTGNDQRVPFFMTPYLGNGSTLRGYHTQRFRGDNTLLLQAEWRIMVNRFMDTALFYDAGKAVQLRDDLNLKDMKSDVGFGFRLHGPLRTLLRLDVAKGSEGYRFVTAVDPVF